MDMTLLEAKAQPCPWTRFWARTLDYLIFGFFLGFVAALLGIPLPIVQQPFMSMIIIFCWVFVEALLLCTWGSTPGKALFRCYVRTSEGHKLTFLKALNRSFSVWWLGMGAGIPLVVAVTMIVASVKLSNCHITTWDRVGHFVVQHDRLGVGRVVLIVFIYFLFLLMVYGSMGR